MAPNQPATPARVIRISEDLWQQAQRAATDAETTPSEIVRRALAHYLQQGENR